MNAQIKITLPPLTFEEFNAIDVIASIEVAELQAELRAMDKQSQARPMKERLLARARAVQAKLAAVRPPAYRDLIAAQYDVCDGQRRPEADPALTVAVFGGNDGRITRKTPGGPPAD
jgi:hypothetical protein